MAALASDEAASPSSKTVVMRMEYGIGGVPIRFEGEKSGSTLTTGLLTEIRQKGINRHWRLAASDELLTA